MGLLVDTAIPIPIRGDRFFLTASMVEGLSLPKFCPCGKLLTWDYMGIVIKLPFDDEGVGLHRLQSVIHRSLKPSRHLGILDPGICPCHTEHRNNWDMVFAGCEPLLDRWQAWISVKN